MQERKVVKLNDHEVPVLISDEKEALLAAQAAGRAVVGLWRPGQEMDALGGVRYVVEDAEDVTDEYAERIARRHLGLPWNICETERLLIREMEARDFAQICANRIGPGLETPEELCAYVKNQYEFYEFGFWALEEKETGLLVGAAGLLVPEIAADDETLELGYHIFQDHRRHGFAKEACRAIMEYGRAYLGVDRFLVRIKEDNEASLRLAESLGVRIVIESE